jgi:hypothetical protein
MKVIQKILKVIKKNQKDDCVLCGKNTEYTKDTNINFRNYYIEGCGQLCAACYGRFYV